jgi:hypothetical protein
LDLARKPRFFDPTAGELHDEALSYAADGLLVRISRGVWVLGRAIGIGTTKDESVPMWDRYAYVWKQQSLASAIGFFQSLALPIPDSLAQDIEDQDQPGNDPVRETEGVCEDAKPPKKTKSRGRIAGVYKIDMALTELNSRLKDGLPTTIVALAMAVGCDPKNLERSKRFMRSYRELTEAMARAARHHGTKTDGNLEAWIDPRGDRDEDEDENEERDY